MLKHIPNIITLVNLLCGCGALVSVLNQQYDTTFYFLLVAGFADYSDGMVARLLKVNSPLGLQLDSLADMVSFGVVPGAILYTLLVNALGAPIDEGVVWAAIPGFLLTLFACMRLAKFNLDVRQTENFVGLNTPAATIFVTGLMLIFKNNTWGLADVVVQPWLLYVVTLVLGLLLIAEIPMTSFKFKGFQWKGNEPRIVFIILGILMLIFFKELTFTLFVLIYVLYSITQHFLIKN